MWYIVYYLLGIILLPGIIYSLVVQSKVNSTFEKFAKVASSKGITAQQAAETILRHAGVDGVKIQHINGNLSDNYNTSNKTLSLSDSTYNSTSIAALGVAAHEVGHAIQHAEGYGFLKMRKVVGTLSNICSNLLMPLIIVGIILSCLAYTDIGSYFVIGGCVFFGLSVLFSLVTLPVEFDASKRAMKALEDSHILYTTELDGAKQVLNAAAKTYVAALVVSILGFLRFILSVIITRESN